MNRGTFSESMPSQVVYTGGVLALGIQIYDEFHIPPTLLSLFVSKTQCNTVMSSTCVQCGQILRVKYM